MISKKKIFAIVVFIIFGLFMFSFANPAEIDNNQPVIGEVEVNKAKLKDAINRGTVIIKNRGTGSDLLKELDNAIKDGQIVFDGETTQKEVDDATKRIEDAIKAIEDDIMNRAKITLVPNTTEKAEFVNLITTVTIDDNKFIDNVKLVNGTNCNANGINLALVNNQAIIRIEENGVYTSCLFLTNGTIKKDTKNISNISKDIEAPKITLNGKDVLKVVLGKTTYTDELAKVTDNVDLENQIKGMLDGSIDKVGAYMLKYNAKDKAGNIAKEVVRTIKVLDPKADEDKDGFTNEEEVDAKTDFDDKNSHPDTVAPIITLKGKNPYVILTTQKYVEPGYGITLDPHDTITKIDNVIISGTITEGTVGRYALNYSITDSYGKSANISRTIVILTPNGDEDKDGYTNKEELDDSKNPLDNKDYPSYDKRPTINLDEKNIYNMIVYDELPTFSATATDVADGKVNVIITHNIDKNQNGIYKVIFKAIDCLENERIIEKEFKVNKRSLIVAIDNKTSIYNASLENLTFIVTKGINVVGNEANIVLTKAIGSNVGKYAIT
ncbi:MAG: DUF5011 domain-containing protein, partial [Bacilli bacterium]